MKKRVGGTTYVQDRGRGGERKKWGGKGKEGRGKERDRKKRRGLSPGRPSAAILISYYVHFNFKKENFFQSLSIIL